jgi:hypothetical protein
MNFLIILQNTTLNESFGANWFLTLKDVILLLVAIIGATSAIVGLRTWRKQLKGNTEYQLARRLMIAVYKSRDYIKFVRNPFMDGGEISQALKEMNEETHLRDPKYDVKVSRAVYTVRWKKLSEVLSELKLELLESEVIWGKEVVNKLQPFYDCIKELNFAIYQHINAIDGLFKLKAEEIKKNNLIIYDTSDDPTKNELSGKFKKAVEEIEKYIKPKLKI